VIIPEALWIPTAKDSVSQFVPQTVLRRQTLSQAAAAANLQPYRVPGDQVLLLLHAWVQGATAGVTLVQNIQINVVDEQLGNVLVIRRWDFISEGFGAAPTSFERAWIGNPIAVLPPNYTLSFDATYSGAAAGNLIQMSFAGVLIPRANWQYG